MIDNQAAHTAVRNVLRHHKLTKNGDSVVEADLIAAVLSACNTEVPVRHPVVVKWHLVPTTLDPAMHKAMDWAFNDAMHVGIPVSPKVWAAALASAPNQPVPASASASKPWDDQLSDAASARAAIYDGDSRQDIKTDVFNAFCKGAMWARVNTTRQDPLPKSGCVVDHSLEKKYNDLRETVGLIFEAVGYKEEYALQWPTEKASVTFKRWFDERPAEYWDAFIEAWKKEIGVDEVVSLLGGVQKLRAVYLRAAQGVS